MKQLTSLRKVFKLDSKLLKKNKWNLELPLSVALESYAESVVNISESQMIRWIDELSGRGNVSRAIKDTKRNINRIKKMPRTSASKKQMVECVDKLNNLMFVPEYINVVMRSEKDYHRANKGFVVNGVKYRRLLGTNGGIKKSTIVYVSENLYDELKKRIDNGRNKDKEFVPAKLEAYQGLCCSSSTPLPKPKGFIVVPDCYTTFKEDVIKIDDECEGEPELSLIKDFEIKHDNSDGFGFMSPSYARRVNKFIEHKRSPLSGMNTRWAWEKGMLCTFDFVHFAEIYAGTYFVRDVWGDMRDVRDADVILTESMLKLWDSYDSMEDYIQNCEENHYQFSVTKTCPEELETVRNMNYQFLQSYQFSEDDIINLCKPTIDEVFDVMGMDYRKGILYHAGRGITENRILRGDFDALTLAMMIDPEMVNDSYVRKKTRDMIRTRIDMAKKGSIMVDGNFAMIFGDPFALAQSMFGLEVTGLLRPKEIYHHYWMSKGSEEVVCYRAPMTCAPNIRKMKVNHDAPARYWFQYIKTGMILNAWDSSCDAMNGADFDGDTSMTTDNPILIRQTKDLPTIMCVQRKARKCIPTEDEIIQANILAFNDDIGNVTNNVTSMFERQAGFAPDSKEYKELEYRIMCGQLYQQNTIDRAKGIVSKSMPKYWYRTKDNEIKEGDDDETIELKKFRRSIVAIHKPYFMIYVYNTLRSDYNKYIKDCNDHIGFCYSDMGISDVSDLEEFEPKTEEMETMLDYYYKRMPVGKNLCTVNRIAYYIENKMKDCPAISIDGHYYNYSRLKSEDGEYSDYDYRNVISLIDEYSNDLKMIVKMSASTSGGKSNKAEQIESLRYRYKNKMLSVCPNEQRLTNILVDYCYSKGKAKDLLWDMVGSCLVNNLLTYFNQTIRYPVQDDEGDFTFAGIKYKMIEMKVELHDNCQ